MEAFISFNEMYVKQKLKQSCSSRFWIATCGLHPDSSVKTRINVMKAMSAKIRNIFLGWVFTIFPSFLTQNICTKVRNRQQPENQKLEPIVFEAEALPEEGIDSHRGKDCPRDLHDVQRPKKCNFTIRF